MGVSKDERNELLGSDLKLAEYILGADLQIKNNGDIDIASDELNLIQAILHRLRTSKGELADIGHPEYGSTIFDFIGERNDEITRARLKLAIRDALRQESRIKEIVSISVKPRLIKGNADESSKTDDSEEKPKGVDMIRMELGTFPKGGSLEQNDKEFSATQRQLDNLLNPSPVDALNTVDIDIVIIPIGKTIPIQLNFPLRLEVA